MARRFHVHKEIRIQPQGLLGCLVLLIALAGLIVLGASLLLPLIGIAFGVGVGLVAVGLLAVGYLRLRAWYRRLRGRRGGSLTTYEGEVLEEDEDDDDSSRPRPRLTVEVRRRPHHE